MNGFLYEKEKTKEISFPLGGIGAGCVGLAGNGRLIDMEIFNRPNKGSHGGFTHFAVKAEDQSHVLDARILNGDLPPPYTGGYHRPRFNSYGFGPDRASLAGLPHFSGSSFCGAFPIASLTFSDSHVPQEMEFPGKITMEAFNPFIPLNDQDSSIPGALFQFRIHNPTNSPLRYTIAFTATNLYTKKGGLHTFWEQDGKKGIFLTDPRRSRDDLEYGDMSIGTDAEETSHQLYWYRGNWFDNLAIYWKDFTAFGPVRNRVYENLMTITDPNYAADDMAMLCASVTVNPGKEEALRFVMTWNTPHCWNYWNPEPGADPPKTWKPYYAAIFEDSRESCLYSLGNYQRLWDQTRLFQETLFDSTLPDEVLDAVSANLSVIKSPTCLRLEDGSLYGFEGCHCDSGCCEGSCTHVWNYTYAIPFLFPKLERSMRTLEYTYNMDPDGGMQFRLQLPLGRGRCKFRPCADGQFGTVMRVLREYRISGDKAWLESIWPMVKKSIQYAWSSENLDQWDSDRDGILEGRQHHTLDMELFGKNSWLSGMYLGGLKAGALLADAVGDTGAKEEFTALFDKGKPKLNQELFNGEYFIQAIGFKDRGLLEPYANGLATMQEQDIFSSYWNEGEQKLMYQIGDGCALDQVLAQWHANLIGLGDIFEKDKTRSALESIYRYNFIRDMRRHFNPCRLYSLNDEKGLAICTWPKGHEKPVIPIPYAEETMTGFEYQAACHMIQEGLVEEGLECVRAIRGRYDGERRNPWNEFECGSNYARSMASYSLLLAFSGFSYDMSKHLIGFSPIGDLDQFRCFWSLEQGWGQVLFSSGMVEIKVLSGSLPVQVIDIAKGSPGAVLVDGIPVPFSADGAGRCMLNQLQTARYSIQLQYTR